MWSTEEIKQSIQCLLSKLSELGSCVLSCRSLVVLTLVEPDRRFVSTSPTDKYAQVKNANYELSNCEVTVYIKTAFPSPNYHNSQVKTPGHQLLINSGHNPDHSPWSPVMPGSWAHNSRETNSRATIGRYHLPLEDQGRVTPTCSPIPCRKLCHEAFLNEYIYLYHIAE